MTCKEAMELFFSLDQGESIPIDLEAHLASCPACAQWIQRMDLVLQAYRNNGQYQIPTPMENRILSAIEALEAAPLLNPPIIPTPGKWMLPGVFLLLGILGIPFSTVFSVFASQPGGNLEVWVPLVLGVVFTAYAASFTGYNLEWLKKKFLT